MLQSTFIKLSIFTVTTLWLVTGTVIPCLCPSDMHCNVVSDTQAAVATPTPPAHRCAACCEASNDEQAPAQTPKTTHPVKVQCTHTAERMNLSITSNNHINVIPQSIEFAFAEPETNSFSPLVIDFATTDVRFEDSSPALYARTLPLLS